MILCISATGSADAQIKRKFEMHPLTAIFYTIVCTAINHYYLPVAKRLFHKIEICLGMSSGSPILPNRQLSAGLREHGQAGQPGYMLQGLY